MKNNKYKSPGFIRRHKMGIACSAVAIAIIVSQSNNIKSMQGFLEDNNLLNDYLNNR